MARKFLTVESLVDSNLFMTLSLDTSRSDDTIDGSACHAAEDLVIAKFQAEIAAKDITIMGLLVLVAELERRLGLNSSNSSKPPSSDGLQKPKREPRTRSLREASGKPSGGQPGHQGTTLRQTENPDVIKDHLPEACPNCGEGLIPTD